jgi:hypothetical protein
MDQVRCSLGEEVEEIADSARSLVDWRQYVRESPWLCLGGAAALGFLLVPGRATVVAANADVLERLLQRGKMLQPELKVRRGMAGALAGLLARAALRGVVGYVAQHAGELCDISARGRRGNDEESNRRRVDGCSPPA